MSKITETSFDSNSSPLEAPGSTIDVPASAIRLVLAGHHPLTLCGLSQVFEKEDDCSVLDVCTDAEAIVGAVRQHEPDVLILDLDHTAAFKVLRRMQRAHLPTRIIVLASASEENEIGPVIRLGVSAIVMKEMPPEAFVIAVRKVHQGPRSVVEEHSANGLVRRLFKGESSIRRVSRRLTPRETEIARLAVLGISTKDIAERLDVKQGTVKIHLHSIYEKLNVGGRLGLILFARRHGLA